jgi:hypothetical protein
VADAARGSAAPPDTARHRLAATAPSGAAGALYGADVAIEGGGQVGVSVRVTVDMTEWELDKIAAFLRLIGHDPARRDG